MRIGVFSGSFDPIHCGHAMVANYIAQYTELDQVLLMPSPLNPLKCDALPADFRHRYEMCRIVARKCSGVKVSDFEKDMPLPSYTYKTLTALKSAFPDDEFKLIIGSDNWVDFEKWRDSEKIIDEFGVLVYLRPGFEVKGEESEKVRFLREAPQAHLSSTFIRSALAENKNMRYFLDPDVTDYIIENNLYK